MRAPRCSKGKQSRDDRKPTSADNEEVRTTRWRALASPIVRLLHLLGLSAFLASIFGSMVLSTGAPATRDPNQVLFAWRAIGSANQLLTVPGLLLMIASGLLLILVQGRDPRQERWLVLKILAVAAILIVSAVQIEPSEEHLRQLPNALPESSAQTAFMNVAVRQEIYGAINIALVVLASALAAFKPRLGGEAVAAAASSIR